MKRVNQEPNIVSARIGKRISPRLVWAILMTMPAVSSAQSDPQTVAVKGFLTGQKMLISYREGSPLRGTYFFLQVHFCRSGNYTALGESRKPTGDNHEQVTHWTETGK